MKAKIVLVKLSLIALLILTGCGNMFTKNKTKFYWIAQESAPKHFYMRIISGTFYYRNENNGLYIPTAAKIGYNWGEGESSHVVGDDFKPLPDRLDIRFYSFWENKLYQGSFDLPYDKILALFKEGVERDKETPIFKKIVAGVAPGGAVAVWVDGQETREVFFGQATPYEAEMRDPLGSLIDDKQEYAESYLQDLPPETYSRIKKEGIPFGIWERYRKTYPWEFTVPKDKETLSIGISFFNGESYRSHFPFNDQHAKKTVPSSIGFTCKFPNDKTKYVYSIGFDYEETNDVLAKLSSNDQQVTIIIDPRLPEKNTTISLTNGKETVELKKIIHR